MEPSISLGQTVLNIIRMLCSAQGLVLPSEPNHVSVIHAQRTNHLHLYSTITTTADHLVSHEINAVYFIRMAWKICLEFVRLKIPNLLRMSVRSRGIQKTALTLSVLSLLALISMRESALHASL